MTTALVLIDLQNDYFPGGTMELFQADAAVAQAAVLLKHFRAASMPVIHVQHIAKEADATFFLPGTKGAEIHSAVQPLATERLVVKHFPNSFRETSLLADLQTLGATKIIFAGMMTHMCVDTTVRAAADQGFECLLAHDACATVEQEFAGETVDARSVQVAYLAALRDAFATVQSTSALCAQFV
jgi:nicotinamidase-related amidase